MSGLFVPYTNQDQSQYYPAVIIADAKLAVFDRNSVYLPTKKIGKNNLLAEEIQADNEASQDWNRTADLALVVGVPEEKVLEIKHEEIQNRSKTSISEHGWLPGLFRTIVQKAKSTLELLIRQAKLPPKPKPGIDMAVFKEMKELLHRLRKCASEIKQIQDIAQIFRIVIDNSEIIVGFCYTLRYNL